MLQPLTEGLNFPSKVESTLTFRRTVAAEALLGLYAGVPIAAAALAGCAPRGGIRLLKSDGRRAAQVDVPGASGQVMVVGKPSC